MRQYLLWFLLAFSFLAGAQIPDPTFYPFNHGVASGDPLSDKVIIWTRVSGANQEVSVDWKMSTDTSFTNIAQSGTASTDSTKDYTLKVDVDGLQPDTWYYYQFELNGRKSLMGRTKTFPTGNNEHIRLAVASCARVNSGAYYNSYLDIAKRNDIQAVVHLGDYIYETQGSVTGKGVQVLPLGETVTLQDYRLRYNTYRLDPYLIRLHQQYPFINVWDDHETANDSYKDGAEAHDSITEGPWADRKAAGQQAYFEWIPIRPKEPGSYSIYRSFSIGDLADLIMIDSRLEGRDEQASTLDQNAYADTNRTILGLEQMQWLKDELSASQAKWKIIGNQVMFAPLQVLGVAFSYEQWDGYQADRNRIINHIMDNDVRNVVMVTGDIHTSWANDIPIPGANYNPNTGAGSAFVEFIGPSITTGSSVNVPQSVISFANPHIKYVELTKDGYFTLDIDSSRAQADWNYVSSIFDTNYTMTQPEHWYVNCDERYLREAGTGVSGFENEAPFAPLTVDNPPVLGLNDATARRTFYVENIYPNPFTQNLNLVYYSQEPTLYEVKLMDIEGRIVHKEQLNSSSGMQTVSLDGSIYAKGTYWLLFIRGKEIIYKKLLVKQ